MDHFSLWPAICIFSCFIFLDRTNSDTTADNNHTMVTKAPNPQQHQHMQTNIETDSKLSTQTEMNGVSTLETPPPSTPCSEQEGKRNDKREGEDKMRGPDLEQIHDQNHHLNGWGNYGPRNTMPHNNISKAPPSRSSSGHMAAHGHLEGNAGQLHDHREQEENVVLRRGFVPRTAPERVAQRKSSMAQLQHWVNQRRGMASQEDLHR